MTNTSDVNRRVYTSQEDFLHQNEVLGTALPWCEDTSVLRQVVSIGKKIAPNRLCAQAMEGCDGTRDGSPDELTHRRYMRFAEGGVGVIWFEATACLEEGRANPRQLWIREDNLDAFKRLVEQIKQTALHTHGYEPIVIMQDTHSGRYSKPHGTPAPRIAYRNPIFEGDHPLDEGCILSDDELDRIGEALVNGAALAERAGFDGVDIKCCHRYLNSELLSAYEREGRYGGSLENRTRLLRESVQGAIQQCSREFLVSSRLNVYDGFAYPYVFGVAEDGSLDFDASEPIWLLKQLSALGVKLLNITMGNPYFNPHVNRPFALGGYTPAEHPLSGVARMLHGTAALKRAVPSIQLICSGLSYLGVAAPNVCAAFVNQGGFDLCGFGRTVFAYPSFAADVLQKGVMDPKQLCICCSKCTEIMRSGSTPGCVVRDSLYGELYKQMKRGNKA